MHCNWGTHYDEIMDACEMKAFSTALRLESPYFGQQIRATSVLTAWLGRLVRVWTYSVNILTVMSNFTGAKYT